MTIRDTENINWDIKDTLIDGIGLVNVHKGSVRLDKSPISSMLISKDIHSIDFTFRKSNINEIISEKSNYNLNFTDGTINAFDLKKTLINRFEGRHITFGKSIKGSELIIKSLHLSWQAFNPELQYHLEKSNVGFDKRRQLFLKQGKRVFKSKGGYVDFGLFESQTFKTKTYQAKNTIEQFLTQKESAPLLTKLFKDKHKKTGRDCVT